MFQQKLTYVFLLLHLLDSSQGAFVNRRSSNGELRLVTTKLSALGNDGIGFLDKPSIDTSSRLSMSTGYDTDEEYSRCLSPKQERRNVLDEGYKLIDERPRWRRALFKPINKVRDAIFPSSALKPGNLIMVCTGTSTWKQNFTFTGWADPDLTEQGIQECEHGARLLIEAGYEPDIIYTSRLKRAIRSVYTIVQELDSVYLPIFKSWRLNERMYGDVTGLSKKETAKRLGSNVVQAWRRSLKARPPPAKKGGEFDPSQDRKYSDLTEEQIPLTESLQDCMERTRPLWDYKISRDLRRGNNVMIVGHSNSLRGLCKIIDDVPDKDIPDITIPAGIPLVYKFDKYMKPITPKEGSLTQLHTSGVFLEKPGLLKEALKRQEIWKEKVPGSEGDSEIKSQTKRLNTMEKSLMKLREEKEMEKWAEQFGNTEEYQVKFANGGSSFVEEDDDEGQFEEDTHTKDASELAGVIPNVGQKIDVDKEPVVVFIRHGRTPHNILSLFTGWEDPPLAKSGVEDAKRGGKLLKKHGYKFDVVYSSWLTRAIETAWYVLDELDMTWLPVIKSWRLNERHYGALTGKSKKMVGNIYGEDQLKKWRRGFNIPPPKTSSFSFEYPGNDYKRTKYVSDIRISLSETLFRSIEAKQFQLHRKFPKSESLKMCMDRSIPFYTERIVPEAVAKGKRVLITSHENAIRGILMHLCEIPEENMNDLHLPNGVPLVYNVRRKCISLLDDGTGEDPLKKYDFGSAVEYLFKPCELLEEDFIVEDETEATEREAVQA
mmetsp:Transcript_19656/g.27272  ORF Transcript_19656/g.27272 Transcript_19656/m.27272 type:complete len:772 (-) Transcript_19656:106-2421(-)